MATHNRNDKSSPLYTPKKDVGYKRSVIAERGRDSDGAFRMFGRIDDRTDTEAEQREAA